MSLVTYILAGIIVIALALTIYYSIVSRSQSDLLHFRFFQAKMNISMGIGLICMSINQFANPDFAFVRLIVGLVFLVLGIFNLGMGSKNYKQFKKYIKNGQAS